MLQFKMIITDMWVPTSEYKEDKNIMEMALKDTTYLGKKRWKIGIINNCQLYMKVFYLSELAHDEETIDRWYLDEKNSACTHHQCSTY